MPCSPIVKAAPALACDHPLGVMDGSFFTVIGGLGRRPAITDTTTLPEYQNCERSAVFDLSGQGGTEFCFIEYLLYEQRADVVRSAVLFLQQNRTRVRMPSTYRSASASVGSLNRAFRTVGSPANASVGSPNNANSRVGLPASAGPSARTVSAASAVA